MLSSDRSGQLFSLADHNMPRLMSREPYFGQGRVNWPLLAVLSLVIGPILSNF